MSGRLLIIGADAAGLSAASEARRHDPNLDIVAFDRGNFASYSQCGMPYWLGGVIERREQLMARSVGAFARRDIHVRLRHDVTAIDAAARTITVRDLEGGRETTEPYDQLLIATGASPTIFPLPGRELRGVFHLDVLEDAIAIHEYLQTERPRRAVVVGGGYIGLEMAENLTRLGLDVHLVQRGEQVFQSVDFEMAELLHAELERHGVNVALCDHVVQACTGSGDRVRQVQTDGGTIDTDLVILATGVRPSVELALNAGVHFGPTGAIEVDRQQRTNVPGVLAAGDCAEHWHRLLGKPIWVPLGTTANKQGRVAGRTAAGVHAEFGGILGTAVAKVFDLGVARTGLTEREAALAGIGCESVVIESTDQAGYMPHAEDLTVKLVVEAAGARAGRLLGAQAVGRAGADKRVDVIATALHAGLTLADLPDLDLAYAPPFNSVWDPVQAAATRLLRR